MSKFKKVYAKCTTPSTQTSPTSPIFDTYLADLGATFNNANPLLLAGECVTLPHLLSMSHGLILSNVVDVLPRQ